MAVPGLATNWLVPIDIGNYKRSGELEIVVELPRNVDVNSIATSRPL